MTSRNYNPWEKLYLHYKGGSPLPSGIPSKTIRQLTYEVATKQNAFFDRAERLTRNTMLSQEMVRNEDPHNRAVAYEESEHEFWINDVRLFINPQHINIRNETYTINSHSLRTSGMSKIPSAKGVIYLNFNVYFVGLDDIDSKLRRIIAQSRTIPIFYIENEVVRQHVFPDSPTSNMAFTLNNLTISTHPESPEILIAQFSMELFNYFAVSDNFYFLNQLKPQENSNAPSSIHKAGQKTATANLNASASQKLILKPVKRPSQSNLFTTYYDCLLNEDLSIRNEIERLGNIFDPNAEDKLKLKSLKEKAKTALEGIKKEAELNIPSMKYTLMQHPAVREYPKISRTGLYDLGNSFRLTYYKYIFFPKEVLNRLAQIVPKDANGADSDANLRNFFGINLAEGAVTKDEAFSPTLETKDSVTNHQVVNIAKQLAQDAIYKTGLNGVEARKAGAFKHVKEFDCTSFVYHVVRSSTGLNLGTSALRQRPNLVQIENSFAQKNSNKLKAKLKVGNKIIELPGLKLTNYLNGINYKSENHSVLAMYAMAIPGVILYDFKFDALRGNRFQHAGISGGITQRYNELFGKAIVSNQLKWEARPYKAHTIEAMNKDDGVGKRSFTIDRTQYQNLVYCKRNIYDEAWLIPGVIYDFNDCPDVWIGLAIANNWKDVASELLANKKTFTFKSAVEQKPLIDLLMEYIKINEPYFFIRLSSAGMLNEVTVLSIFRKFIDKISAESKAEGGKRTKETLTLELHEAVFNKTYYKAVMNNTSNGIGLAPELIETPAMNAVRVLDKEISNNPVYQKLKADQIKNYGQITAALLKKTKTSQEVQLTLANNIQGAAKQAYELLVKQIEAWRKEAKNKDWEMIWTTDGNFLFRKKAVLNLSGQIGKLFQPPGNTKHELNSFCTNDLTYLSLSISNIFARLPLIGQPYVTHQYIGSNDLNAVVQLTTTGNGFIGQLNLMHKYNQLMTKLFRRIPNVGVIEVENEILNMAGSKHFLINSIDTKTVPQSPHLYTVNLSLTEWNIKQRQKEDFVQEKVTNLNTKNKILTKLLSGIDFGVKEGFYKDFITIKLQTKKGLLEIPIEPYEKYTEYDAYKKNKLTREDEIRFILGVMIVFYLLEIAGLTGFYKNALVNSYLNSKKYGFLNILSSAAGEINNIDLLKYWIEQGDAKTKKILTPFQNVDLEGLDPWKDILNRFRVAIFGSKLETYKLKTEDKKIEAFQNPTFRESVLEDSRAFVNTWTKAKVPRVEWFRVIGRNSWVQTFEWLKNNFSYYGAGGGFVVNFLADLLGVSKKTSQIQLPNDAMLAANAIVNNYRTNGTLYNQKLEEVINLQYSVAASYACLMNLLREDIYSLINIAVSALRTTEGYFQILNESVENAVELKGNPAYQDIPLPFVHKENEILDKSGTGKTKKIKDVYYCNPSFFWYNQEEGFDLNKFISLAAAATKEGFNPSLAMVSDFGILPSKPINLGSKIEDNKKGGIPGPLAQQGSFSVSAKKIKGLGEIKTPEDLKASDLRNLPETVGLFIDTPYLLNSNFKAGKLPSISKSMNIGVSNITSNAYSFDASKIKDKNSFPLYRDKHPFALDNVSFGMSGISEQRIPVTMDRNPRSALEVFYRSFGNFQADSLNMNRVFPAFKLYFIEDDTSGKYGLDPKSYIRSYDDFFAFNAIKEIKHVSSRKIASAVLIIRLSNLFGNLDNLEFSNSIWDKTDIAQPKNTENAFENIDAASLDTVLENPFKRLILKDGMRVQFKGGYENNPEDLPVVFNGQIVEINQIQGDEIVIVCQDFGTQLVAERKGNTPSDYKSDWSDTFELLSWAISQPEMTYFGRWGLNVPTSIGESRSTGGWEKIFNIYKESKDDNIYVPRRHEMISLQSDNFGGLVALTKWIGRKLSASVQTTETKYGNITTKYVQSIGTYDVYVTQIPKKIYNMIDAIEANQSLGIKQNSSTINKNQNGAIASVHLSEKRGKKNVQEGFVNYTTVTEGRGDSGLLDYVIYQTKIWNIFKEMELRHPGWIGHPVPYGDRMTMFFGLPTQLYWWRPLTRQEEIEAQGIVKTYNETLLQDEKIKKILKEASSKNQETFGQWFNNLGAIKFYRKHWIAIEAGLALATGGLSILRKVGITAGLRFGAALAKVSQATDKYLKIAQYGAAITAAANLGVGIASELNANSVLGSVGIATALNSRLYQKVVKKQLESRLKTFRNYHLITSEHHIVSNQIKSSLNGIYNAFTIEYDPSDAGGTSSSSKMETLTLKATYDILDKDIRMGFMKVPQCRTRFMANRYAQGLLIRYLKDMYQGEVTIWGNWKIKPYDMINIADRYSNITGRFEVEKVVNLFNAEIGHLTMITPDFCAYGNNIIDLVYDDYESWFGIFQDMNSRVAIRNIFEYDNLDMIQKTKINQSRLEGRFLKGGLKDGIGINPNTQPLAGRNKRFGEDGLVHSGAAAYGIGSVAQLATSGTVGRSLANVGKLSGGIALGTGLFLKALNVPRSIHKALAIKFYNWTTERQPLIFQPLMSNGRPLMSGIPIERIGMLQRFKEGFLPYISNLTKGFDILEVVNRNIYLQSISENLSSNLN